MEGVCTYERDASGVYLCIWKGCVPMQGGCWDVYLGKEGVCTYGTKGMYLWKD